MISVYTLSRMNDRVDLMPCKDCYCLAARRTAREITRIYEAGLRPFGLRATQFSILAALSLMGPTPVGDLADVLGLERTSLTRSAAVVERNGWIVAGRSTDAREHVLQVTEAGRAKIEAAFPAWQEAQTLIGEKLAAGDLSSIDQLNPR